MAVERTVRIVRIWDVPVQAEYGDTDEMLLAKAEVLGDPCNETKNLLPGEVTE